MCREVDTAYSRSKPSGRIRVSDLSWLHPRTSFPSAFLVRDGISIPLDHALTPAEMSQHITAATGLRPVRFVGRPPRSPAGAREVRFAARSGRVLGGQGQWSGPLPALLDEWAQAHGYQWRYNEATGVIEVVRGLSAVFQIHALGGTQSYHVASSTAGGGSKTEGTLTADFSEQRLDTEYKFDPWPDIESAVKGLMSEGSIAEVSPAQASVIVAGLPGGRGTGARVPAPRESECSASACGHRARLHGGERPRGRLRNGFRFGASIDGREFLRFRPGRRTGFAKCRDCSASE